MTPDPKIEEAMNDIIDRLVQYAAEQVAARQPGMDAVAASAEAATLLIGAACRGRVEVISPLGVTALLATKQSMIVCTNHLFDVEVRAATDAALKRVKS